jgi:DNA invertase Pin-like site-specific DNA recombinase
MKKRSNRVIGYLRVSTEEQAVSGLGLADQRCVISAEAARRGWTDIVYISDSGYSAKNLSRPGIAEALGELKGGRAGLLVVSKLDRLSRSLLDFAGLMETASNQGWELVVLDLAVDTTTPSGKLMASVMSAFSEYERMLIGARTKAALQQLKTQGVRLGRPSAIPQEIKRHISDLRKSGQTLAAIAADLNTRRIPTAREGKCWYPSSVQAVLRSVELDRASACFAADLTEVEG